MGILNFLKQPLLTMRVEVEKASVEHPDVRGEPGNVPQFEHILAPRTLSEFVGQRDAVRLLEVEVRAWRSGSRTLPLNLLFYGPPGLGKSSLAYCLANELGLKVYPSTAAEFQGQSDVLRAVGDMGTWEGSKGYAPDGILWLLDELDGAENRRTMYPIYPLLTSRVVHFKGEKYGFRKPLVIVATCNHMSGVNNALKSRLVSIPFDYYPIADLTIIATAVAKKLGFDLSPDAAMFVAESSAGEPRKVLHILRVLWNLGKPADLVTAKEALHLSGLRAAGLSVIQVKILQHLSQGPTGLASLAAITGLSPQDVQIHEEPYLLRAGYVHIGAKGRANTQKGLDYLAGRL